MRFGVQQDNFITISKSLKNSRKSSGFGGFLYFAGGMNMDYMTLREASEKGGISTRQINYYCTEDRIPGVVKVADVWLTV